MLMVIVATAGFMGSADAQISPVPQKMAYGTKAFDTADVAFVIENEADADQDAVSALKADSGCNIQEAGGIPIVIGESGDAAVAAYEDNIPAQAEGYWLKVEKDRVVIAGRKGKGTFYGVQSFLQLLQQQAVAETEVSDWPDTKLRGVIEGFYGNPWSTHDRERQFDFYGANKMNIYVYGPKDDPYHRAQWRTDYPSQEGKVIQHLAEYARKNKVEFVWAVHPGGDIKWTLADSNNVVKKFESVYKLGVRCFAVFFDDIGGEGAKAEKQAGLMNYVTDQFVRKHDDVQPLIICPTQYNRSWSSGDYLSILGTQMYEEVRIMWTGNSVVDMINKSDMTWINSQIRRNAFIWLNYPVTDYCIGHMLMGKTYGNDRDIYDLVSAFCSNPMEYAEASKVSLYSIADYTWNMEDYDAQSSWKRAIPYLMPTCADAFRIFCENNIDLGTTYHGLRREGESETFAKAQKVFEKAMEEGAGTAVKEAVAAMTLQFDSLVWAADALREDSVNHPEMLEEITPWVNVMRYIGQRGRLTLGLYNDIYDDRPEDFRTHYQEILAIQKLEDGVKSRDFEGSIKVASPVVAGEVIVPFLKAQLVNLVQLYKSRYSEGWDIFPMTVLENGNYYIRYQGRLLTDVNASSVRTGDYPVFKAEADTINPMRQQWTIKLDPSTSRYSITNTQDGRYINEKGSFWASQTSNPYDAAWHSYYITRMNGRYAIQNAGSAGKKFWTASTSRISQGSNDSGVAQIGDFLFEITPVENDTVVHPVVSEGEKYYIQDTSGNYLTDTSKNGTGTPKFQKGHGVLAKPYQEFYITPVEATGRWKITSVKTKKYINEIGNFGTNAYSDEWNTYVLTECNGLFAIQNADKAGTDYWEIADSRCQKGSKSHDDSYIFRIVSVSEETGIEHVGNGDGSAGLTGHAGDTYSVSGIALPSGTSGQSGIAGIYIKDSKKYLR